jgi:hypothetical protein
LAKTTPRPGDGPVFRSAGQRKAPQVLDGLHPERWTEFWVVASWTEHLREAARMSEEDRAALARAAALHRGDGPPEAARYLNVVP